MSYKLQSPVQGNFKFCQICVSQYGGKPFIEKYLRLCRRLTRIGRNVGSNAMAQTTVPEIRHLRKRLIFLGEFEAAQNGILCRYRNLCPRIPSDLEKSHEEQGEHFSQFFDLKQAGKLRHSVGSQQATGGESVALVTGLESEKTAQQKLVDTFSASKWNIFFYRLHSNPPENAHFDCNCAKHGWEHLLRRPLPERSYYRRSVKFLLTPHHEAAKGG